jgi:hypothetical protein
MARTLTCRAPACEDFRSVELVEGYEEWCQLHGNLLLDHHMQGLEQDDSHFHADDRRHCPGCHGWDVG